MPPAVIQNKRPPSSPQPSSMLTLTSDEIPSNGKGRIGAVEFEDGVAQVKGPVKIQFRLGACHLGYLEFGPFSKREWPEAGKFQDKGLFVACWLKDHTEPIIGICSPKALTGALAKYFPSALPGELLVVLMDEDNRFTKALEKFGVVGDSIRSVAGADFLIDVSKNELIVSSLAPIAHPEVYGERSR